MMLWTILAAMMGAAVMSVLLPLSRRAAAASPAEAEVAFYRDQIGEIARDQERGLLDPAEAEGARAEAARRLLRAAPAANPEAGSTGEPALRRRRAAAAFGLAVVPLVALAAYAGVGRPDLPGKPLAARGGADGGRLDFATALVRIEQHLAAHPEDGRGWDLVAPIYLRAGRFGDADRAYAAALRLAGASPTRLIGRGEALVGANGGVMTADAREIFEQASALDAARPEPQYYLGLAAEQDGDAAEAIRRFRTILAGAPADAPWLAAIRERLAKLGAEAEAPKPSFAGTAVPPEIRAMVDGLDGRLAAGGGEPEEWERLVRSYVVLGEPEKAQASLMRARTALSGDAVGAARVLEAARALGLEPAGGPP